MSEHEDPALTVADLIQERNKDRIVLSRQRFDDSVSFEERVVKVGEVTTNYGDLDQAAHFALHQSRDQVVKGLANTVLVLLDELRAAHVATKAACDLALDGDTAT